MKINSQSLPSVLFELIVNCLSRPMKLKNKTFQFLLSTDPSIVWKFTTKGKNHLKCKICGHKWMSLYCGSTSNILRHIKTRHAVEFKTEADKMENYKEKIKTFKGNVNKSVENTKLETVVG